MKRGMLANSPTIAPISFKFSISNNFLLFNHKIFILSKIKATHCIGWLMSFWVR
jgi:hypothetical protein